MIGEIPAREARVVVQEHLVDGTPPVDAAMRARYLPHAIQDAADFEVGGELQAACCGQGHARSLIVGGRGLNRQALRHSR
jgi:hypothetical protein